MLVQPGPLQQAGVSTPLAPSIWTLVPAASMLPSPPPEPGAVNLDVTTLCAMVSEVCNSDVRHPDIQQWAARVTHWQVRYQLTSTLQHCQNDCKLQDMFQF